MKEYIEKDTALETTYEPFTMSMCMTVPECNGMNRAREMIFKQLRDIPAADVVDGETYRELLKAARKMHCWIFLNTADELDAYDECGLTDEMNSLLGYGGQFTANMDGGDDDAAD